MINFVDGKQSWRLLVRALRCLVDSGQSREGKAFNAEKFNYLGVLCCKYFSQLSIGAY